MPTPEKSIKQIESEQRKQLKKKKPFYLMNNVDDRILKCQFGISKLIYDIQGG